MIFARLHMLFKGKGSRAHIVVVDLERVEQQQHVPGQEHHSLPDTGRDGAHADHELVKERGAAPVRQLVRHRGKKLSQRRILGDALAVATGMDDQHPQSAKGAFLLI